MPSQGKPETARSKITKALAAGMCLAEANCHIYGFVIGLLIILFLK